MKNLNNPIILNSDFKMALDLFESQKKNLLITGKAGTGKSTLLSLMRKTTRKNIAFLAPTGIAALNIKGQTVHSFFRLPPRLLTAELLNKSKTNYLLRKIDALVIDEISMIRADVLDGIDFLLKKNRKNSLPFGGVQFAFFGDLFQLPPVISSPAEKEYFHSIYGGPYFFQSLIWRTLENIETVELSQVYRQEQGQFLNILNSMRMNQLDWDELETLNERCLLPEDDENLITLSPIRSRVASINNDKLSKLLGEPRAYSAELTGDVNLRQVPANEVLIIKPGAQVMFVKNDVDRRFVNGTIGTVVECLTDKVIVKIHVKGDIKTIEVEQEIWEMIKYSTDSKDSSKIEAKVTGTFKQFPLKLAWAMTIHKSQGKTFDRVMIDFGRGAFESGQAYVAFSRCRTLDGIYLKQPLRMRDIILDEGIIDFYRDIIR